MPRRPFISSNTDPVLIQSNVLDTLLISECSYSPDLQDYLKEKQEHLNARHRKIVTDWMLEVCQEQKCPPQVFLSSVQFLDILLCKVSIRRDQFQLFASACILLSSKLHDPHQFSVSDLVIYTDCSISSKELQAAEMLILRKLQWELAVPNATQFLDILLANMQEVVTEDESKQLKMKAIRILCCAATEYKFFCVKPSLMSISSLALSSQLCSLPLYTQNIVINTMMLLTRTPMSHVSLVTSAIQEILAENVNNNNGIAKEVVTMNMDCY